MNVHLPAVLWATPCRGRDHARRAGSHHLDLAVLGAVLFTAAIIASAVVVGDATDDLIVPVLQAGEPVSGRLAPVVWLVLGISVWKAAGIILRRGTASSLQITAMTYLRRQLIHRPLGATLRWYARHGVGDLLSTADVDTKQATFVLAPLPFATGVVGLLVGAGGGGAAEGAEARS